MTGVAIFQLAAQDAVVLWGPCHRVCQLGREGTIKSDMLGV